jgi:hypothetical protein
MDGRETSGSTRRNVLHGFGLVLKFVALWMIRGKGNEKGAHMVEKHKQTNKLRGLRPRTNYTDRAAAAGRRS